MLQSFPDNTHFNMGHLVSSKEHIINSLYDNEELGRKFYHFVLKEAGTVLSQLQTPIETVNQAKKATCSFFGVYVHEIRDPFDNKLLGYEVKDCIKETNDKFFFNQDETKFETEYRAMELFGEKRNYYKQFIGERY